MCTIICSRRDGAGEQMHGGDGRRYPRTRGFRKGLSKDGNLSMCEETLDLVQLLGVHVVLAPSPPADAVVYDDDQVELVWVACLLPCWPQ